MSLAFVFPGQGSQSVGMQADLAEHSTIIADTYAEASEILGYDLWSLVQSGTAEKLGETTVTQPAMLAELMQAAVPVGVGAMAAILGLDDDVVVALCSEAAGDEVCDAVNFN